MALVTLSGAGDVVVVLQELISAGLSSGSRSERCLPDSASSVQAAGTMASLSELAGRLANERAISAACGEALGVAMALTGATCAEVLFRAAQSHQLVCIATAGDHPWCVSQSGGRALASKLVEVPLQDQVPMYMPDVGRDSRVDFPLESGAELTRALSVPMIVRGRALGAINLCGASGARLDLDAVEALEVVAGLLAPVIENLYVRERATSEETERRQSMVRELEASEDERRRIARELHDGVGQTLTGLAMTIDGARARLLRPGGELEAAEMLQRSRDAATIALQDIRRVILALRPPALDDMGLFAALQAYATRTLRDAAIELVVRTSGQPRELPPLLENVVFRVAQEAINNVARHSAANNCKLTLTGSATTLRVCIQDDGLGFDPDSITVGHFGFGNMRERVELIDGRLVVDSKPGRGTTVDVRVVYKRQAGATD